jgi:hypothetical protein
MSDCTTPWANMAPDGLILPIVTELAGCVEAALEQRGFTDPCFYGIVAGQSVDSTHIGEEGGWMAWVREGEIAVAAETAQKCGVSLTVDIEVGFLTCYPVEADGSALSVDQNLGIVQIVDAARMALLSGIQCCEWQKYPAPAAREVDHSLTRWAPVGPLGQIIGGAWYLTIDF